VNLFRYQDFFIKKSDDSAGDYPDPAFAAIFALTGISLGQFYNGRPLRGLMWGAGGIALVLLVRDNMLIVPASIFFLLACAIDAYSTAQEMGSCAIPFSKISRLFWIEIMLAAAAGTALCITTILHYLYFSGISQ